MILRCKKCKGKHKLDSLIWVSKEDAWGFSFFCIALAAPLGFITFILELSEIATTPFYIGLSLFLAFIFRKNLLKFIVAALSILIPIEIIIYMLKGLDIFPMPSLGMTSAEIGFILAFYRVSYRPYKFFSLFVNYKLKFKVSCDDCGNIKVNYFSPKRVSST
mgnify:FL=1